MLTTSSRTAHPLTPHETLAKAQDEVAGACMSRTLVVGMAYGLVGWFHLVLIPAYALAGLVGPKQMDGYPVGAWAWATAYVVTGLAVIVVALGLVSARPWAWRVAPWVIVPNIVAHLVFFAVLPVWGSIAVFFDLFAIALVVHERRRFAAMVEAAAADVRRRRPPRRRVPPVGAPRTG